MQTINAKQLKQKLDNGEDLVVINALPPKSFQKKHIPGSISFPVHAIQDLAEHIVPDTDQTIIVHCSSKNCTTSTTAASAFNELGYSDIYDFEAGLTGWLRAGCQLSGEFEKQRR